MATSTYVQMYQRNNDTGDAIRWTVSVVDGAWHHIVVVSTGIVYNLLIDGIDKGTPTASTGANNGDWFADTPDRDNLTIGGALTSGGLYSPVAGLIADVRVYNYALTLANAQSLYAGINPAVAPVAEWDFSEPFTGTPSDGDPVVGLLSAGNVRMLTQVTAANRMTYKASLAALNNQPCLSFDGDTANQYLTALNQVLQGETGWVGILLVTPTDVTTKQTLLCAGDTASATRYLDLYIETGTWRIAQDNGAANSTIVLQGTTTCAAETAYLVEFASTGTAYTITVNKVALTLTEDTAGDNNGDWFGDTTALDNLVLGAKVIDATSAPFGLGANPGYIAAVLLLDRAATSGEKAKIRLLCHRTYGVPA